MPDIYTTSTELYSYREAWAEAARLQARGYVTQVTRADGGRGYQVSYATHADYLAWREVSNDDRNEG